MTTNSRNPRVLLYSQRNVSTDRHFRLGLYEFENIIRSVDNVELLAPGPKKWFKYGKRISSKLALDYNIIVDPGVEKTTLKKDYDLLFVVAQFPKDLLNFKLADGWKDRCKASICWMNEMWLTDVENCKYARKILSQFDYIILQWVGSIDRLKEVTKTECVYSPYGIDAIYFCPYPDNHNRPIDVYSIGRRSESTHQALLEKVKKDKIFYIYETVKGSETFKPIEHRILLSNMMKRSKYWIANPGKINIPGETAGQIEFGNRFFEGVAAGTIMIGEKPTNEKFPKVFDWENAMIELPFDSKDIGSIIDDLDANPSKQIEIRTNNVVNALRKHVWVYRWEKHLTENKDHP